MSLNEETLNYHKECNFKLFFYIIQLREKLKDLEDENERLKNLLQKYNKDSLEQDNQFLKRVLLVLSIAIFIIVFFLF